jgi:hypothetical protein
MKEHSMSALLICEKYIVVSVNGVPKEVSEIYSGDSDNNPRSVYSSGPEPGETIFTTSGIFTVPKGVKSIDVFCVGGGSSGDANNVCGAGGGGGGGYTSTVINTEVDENQQISVVVGTGGNNSVGGTSSAGSICTANGGTYYNNGGSGGGVAYYYFSYYTQFNTNEWCKIIASSGGSDGSDGCISFGTQRNVYSNYVGAAITVNGGKGQGTTTRYFEESDGTLYAGGGGGGGYTRYGVYQVEAYSTHYGSISGGAGGGGNGIACDGETGTGGGGGGCNRESTSYESFIHGGNGGSGICIIRWGK